MEVADNVVVMNRGRVEQAATPAELYDTPANEFVMSFVGHAMRLGDSWVRPHDLEVVLDADESTREALVERVVNLGFEVRAELVSAEGDRFNVELSRGDAERLELERGQIVFVRTIGEQVFSRTA